MKRWDENRKKMGAENLKSLLGDRWNATFEKATEEAAQTEKPEILDEGDDAGAPKPEKKQKRNKKDKPK